MSVGEYFHKQEVFTVGELSSLISQVLRSELFMDIKVQGEILSKQVKNGNVYLTLVDPGEKPDGKKAVIKVIVFSWYDKQIKEEYKEGDEVIARGDLSYYAPFGQLSFNAKDIALYGEGLELIKLKRLEEKLTKEGLFDPAKKRPLPTHIHKIAIITSASGAAYHDIMETLSKKIPVSTVLFDALVQGGDAPSSLIRALKRAYKSDADVIIFGRGGGSKTDLSCFNDEKLVRTLASSPIPVITGIGHEIDRSLCDLAADKYAITPTEAANVALPDLSEVLKGLQDRKNALENAGENFLKDKELNFNRLGSILDKHSPVNYLSRVGGKLSQAQARLSSLYLQRLLERKVFLEGKANELDKANPLNGLKAGVGLIRFKEKPVSSVKDVKKGDEVEIGLHDGVLNAEIK
ncbi:MAG: exodeoxyribonuclease VII large subunit [Bacilli bacterium]|jgi:exodeoxyribonuclease VII large subunit|nr:exodeoxyribonuclease VII large subunit [Bacilli bacterium]